MKIFGKRKSTPAATPDATSSTPGIDDAAGEKSGGVAQAAASAAKSANVDDVGDVPSYFSGAADDGPTSSKNKKNRKDNTATVEKINGEDIETLLAMDPAELNAKQRRLVRRHQEREEGGEAEAAADAAGAPTGDAKSGDDNAPDECTSNEISKDESSDKIEHKNQPPTNNNEQSTGGVNITEILAKLEGLNSKDRRKLLRQLKTSSGGAIDESVIAAAEEKALRVAERNEKEAANATASGAADKSSKRKSSGSGGEKKAAPDERAGPKKKRRKKGPPVDLGALTPEERKRREEQRAMQQEAAERRAGGLVADPDFRHPLNSERRRANRRKPGKAALIAQAKREQMAEKGKWNAFGFQKRKGGGT